MVWNQAYQVSICGQACDLLWGYIVVLRWLSQIESTNTAWKACRTCACLRACPMWFAARNSKSLRLNKWVRLEAWGPALSATHQKQVNDGLRTTTNLYLAGHSLLRCAGMLVVSKSSGLRWLQTRVASNGENVTRSQLHLNTIWALRGGMPWPTIAICRS